MNRSFSVGGLGAGSPAPTCADDGQCYFVRPGYFALACWEKLNDGQTSPGVAPLSLAQPFKLNLTANWCIALSSSPNAVSLSSARTRGPYCDHSFSLNNCSTSGTVVNAPTATSVQPIARLCSAVSFSESNSAMPAPSIARVPAMRPI